VDSTPKVTVLMTAYNEEAYIEGALRSALNQTFGDFEIVAVDDGSTDGAWERLVRAGSPQIRAFRQPHRGRAEAVNRAAAEARGRFFAFLDADDAWHPEKLARQMGVWESHPEIDLVFTQSEWIGADGKGLGITTRPWDGPMSARELFCDNVTGNASSVMVRREAFEAAGGFDPKMPACIDLDCWVRIGLLREGNLWGIPEPLTLHRRHDNQITADWRRMQAGWNRLLEKLEGRSPELLRHRRIATANMRRFWFALAWQRKERLAAASHLACALRGAPWAMFTDSRNWKLTLWLLRGQLRPRRTD